MKLITSVTDLSGPERRQAGRHPRPCFDRLVERNERFAREFEKNELFRLARSGALRDEATRNRFLDAFQVWSNKYQKMVLSRSALSDHPSFRDVTQKHLVEEFGHDSALAGMRAGRPVRTDPMLEAACAWFLWKITTLSELERIFFVNTVIERVSTVFYKFLRPALEFGKDAHFSVHDEVDHDHQLMGLDELRDLREREYARLEEIQEETWRMCDLLMSQLARLTENRVEGN